VFRSGVYIIICLAACMAAGPRVPVLAADVVRAKKGACDCTDRVHIVVFDYNMEQHTREYGKHAERELINTPGLTDKERLHASVPGVKKGHSESTRSIKKKNIEKASSAAVKTERKANRTLLRYRVRRGDTLFGISRKFRVSLDELCTVNRIRNKSRIRYGQVLLIPGGTASGTCSVKKKTAGKVVKNKRARRPSFTWPVNRVYSCRRDGSRGVQSIGIVITARPGSKVTSSAGGVVKKIGEMRGYGRYVIVVHEKRYVTVYANLGSIRVSEGDRIRAGSMIGSLGSDSRTLHFQIDREGKPQNPLSLLPARS